MNDEQYLTGIADSANLSPTFINWFSDDPTACLKELYRFWLLKEEIEEALEFQLDWEEMTNCNTLDCKECNNISKKWGKKKALGAIIRDKIKQANFVKDGLF